RGDITGMLCGLCSGFLYALVVIFNKFIKGVDPYAKTIIQLAASSCAMLPYMFFKQSYAGDVWNLNSLILMLIIGVVNTGLAYALYFGSIENKNLKAQTIALFGYLDPVTALILAALILGESLSIYGIIGVILILGAALVCELE
nr:DMT family transporter [Synergistaceae bacterium]